MIRVQDILPDAIRILGHHDLTLVFRRITEAVELLANRGDFDPLLGVLDICTSGRVVTLPSEVETVLAVNMLGQPAIARDELYQFHVNGPGTCGPAIRYEWVALAEAPVYRDLSCPAVLRAYAQLPEDAGAELWVYGYDISHQFIRTQVSATEWRDGWRVPVVHGVAASVDGAPQFARITAVQKALTRGPIRLTAVQGDEEVLLAVYQSYETVPRMRRILLSECVPWVRIHFRRRTWAVRHESDLLPVPSASAVLMMLRALKAYETGNIPEGEAYEATALRWAADEQRSRNAVTVHPVQVAEGGALLAPTEWLE